MTTVIWQLLIGLGVFLFGMHQLENGIKSLSGAALRRWIPRATNTPLSSSFCGVAVTAVLQSSSMVSLLVLAFASAGLIPLMNAVGVLLGANLGTTFTGWVVATLGFKLDLEAMAIPMTGVAGALVVMSEKAPRLRATGETFLGLGLLLFGLSLMKDSVAGLPEQWDIRSLQGLSPWVYFLAGALVTALIQSSSAAMMMTLTALNAELIALPEAMALVIGADLGTTSTTILGSLTGSTVKKQLAFSHCFYNLVVDIAAFLILLPWAEDMLAWLEISDPLYGLVAFHSIMNFIGLLVFLPLLRFYSRWIEHLFKEPEVDIEALAAMPEVIPEAALPVMARRVREIWVLYFCNVMAQFQLKIDDVRLSGNARELIEPEFHSRDFMARYEAIKGLERQILQLSVALQRQRLDESQSRLLSDLLNVARALTYSAKTLKDIQHSVEWLRQDDSSLAESLLTMEREHLIVLQEQLYGFVTEVREQQFSLEMVDELHKTCDQHQQSMDELVYREAVQDDSLGDQVSSLLNVSRELRHAEKESLRVIAAWQLCLPAVQESLK